MSHATSLRALYASLTDQLPPSAGNPCGACNACCTGSGLSWQNVPGVELDALARRYGRDQAADFRAYAERRRDANGDLMHPTCPFYDASAQECAIYDDRPFSCRVFGHFRLTGTKLPDPCVFVDQAREIADGAYLREVPLALGLRDLQRAFEARRPTPTGSTESIPHHLLERVHASLDLEDPADLATLAQLQGRHGDAVALLTRAVEDHPDDAWRVLALGNAHELLGQGESAIAAYTRALALDPENPRAWTHLGFTRLEMGDVTGGRDAFARAAGLCPDDATSRGFLGWLTMVTATTHDAFFEAAAHLRVAAALAPDNGLFRLRCAEALLLVGEPAEALCHLNAAAADARYLDAARALVARFKAEPGNA